MPSKSLLLPFKHRYTIHSLPAWCHTENRYGPILDTMFLFQMPNLVAKPSDLSPFRTFGLYFSMYTFSAFPRCNWAWLLTMLILSLRFWTCKPGVILLISFHILYFACFVWCLFKVIIYPVGKFLPLSCKKVLGNTRNLDIMTCQISSVSKSLSFPADLLFFPFPFFSLNEMEGHLRMPQPRVFIKHVLLVQSCF